METSARGKDGVDEMDDGDLQRGWMERQGRGKRTDGKQEGPRTSAGGGAATADLLPHVFHPRASVATSVDPSSQTSLPTRRSASSPPSILHPTCSRGAALHRRVFRLRSPRGTVQYRGFSTVVASSFRAWIRTTSSHVHARGTRRRAMAHRHARTVGWRGSHRTAERGGGAAYGRRSGAKQMRPRGTSAGGGDPAASLAGRPGASRDDDAHVRVIRTQPEVSLQRGQWVKLICGASFEDAVSVRALATVYALAGVDCIDCAADQAVVQAVREGIAAAVQVAIRWGCPVPDPWLMVSVNDGNDPHFRKAVVKPDAECPHECSRPCEAACPAAAFRFTETSAGANAQVIEERCYGCGRCMPVCPYGLLEEEWYRRSSTQVADLLRDVDAIEIHTREGHLNEFRQLWQELAPALRNLKLVAVSAPRLSTDTAEELAKYHACMVPPTQGALLWQLDGRPMSGDIGKGATQAVVRLASEVVARRGGLPGYLQLAGGTNLHTHAAAKEAGLLQKESGKQLLIHGVAFGGVARKLLSNILKELEEISSAAPAHIEEHPHILKKALHIAEGLVAPWKE